MARAQEPVPEGINELPDPAAFARPPDALKRPKKKARGIEEESGANITSLLDILTILLVFLLKSYSTSPVQMKQANDLKLPMSTTDVDPLDSTAIAITLNHILVDDKPAAVLDDGKVAKADLEEADMMIRPLFDKLIEAVAHNKKIAAMRKSEFKGILTMVADRHVPFSLLTQVMYTAGQAEYSTFNFAAIKKGQ